MRRRASVVTRSCVAARELGEILVRLLHEEGGAGRGAASTDPCRLNQRDADARVRKPPRERRTRNAAAHDGDIDLQVLRQRWKTDAALRRIPCKPEWRVDAKARHFAVP